MRTPFSVVAEAAVALALITSPAALAQSTTLSRVVKQYTLETQPRIVLTHVRVIDGTGAAAVADQNITIENGKITAIGAGADVASGAGVTVMDLRGATVMPGIVGMHEHLYNIAEPNLTGDDSGGQPPLLLPQIDRKSVV